MWGCLQTESNICSYEEWVSKIDRSADKIETVNNTSNLIPYLRVSTTDALHQIPKYNQQTNQCLWRNNLQISQNICINN